MVYFIFFLSYIREMKPIDKPEFSISQWGAVQLLIFQKRPWLELLNLDKLFFLALSTPMVGPFLPAAYEDIHFTRDLAKLHGISIGAINGRSMFRKHDELMVLLHNSELGLLCLSEIKSPLLV